MNKKLVKAFNELNSDFYRRISDDFSATRSFSWQGWNQLLPFFKKKVASLPLRILDLGCGNGRLVEFLQVHLRQQFSYLGLDSAMDLLAIAQKKYPEQNFEFFDLVEKYLETGKIILPTADKFDLIFLFGLSHHLPSQQLRAALFGDLKKYLKDDGLIIVSNWQFAAEPERFQKNILTWSKIWQNQKINLWQKVKLFYLLLNLEKNDFLLDWRKGEFAGRVFRYCHFLDEVEMKELAAASELKVVTKFAADGKSGELNQYFVLTAL